jgi:hypothetical protein
MKSQTRFCAHFKRISPNISNKICTEKKKDTLRLKHIFSRKPYRFRDDEPEVMDGPELLH